MSLHVAIIYNNPQPDRYHAMDESKAELGVLDAVEAVKQALETLQYSCYTVPLNPPLDAVSETLKKLTADVVFNLFEGFDGNPETEINVAKMLSETKIPYTGNPASALELALHKERSKTRFRDYGIPTPDYQILSPVNFSSFHLNFPCIVKPLSEDSSHGISNASVVYDPESLFRQLEVMSRLFGGKALVEIFLTGREYNVTVMGNRRLKVLPVSEIVYSLPPEHPPILTFAAKWETSSYVYRGTLPVCPARITLRENWEIGKMARLAYKAMGCRGYARVDLRYDTESGKINVLEVNPNPDITPGSGAALQVEASGMSYPQYIKQIILMALTRG